VQASKISLSIPRFLISSTIHNFVWLHDVALHLFSEQEIEYLFPPCSFVQEMEHSHFECTADGPVKVVAVRINANQKTLTVQQIEETKKRMHLDAFEHLSIELKRDVLERKAEFDSKYLNDPLEKGQRHAYAFKDFTDKIFTECQKLLDKHKATPISTYLEDEGYRNLVIEMLEMKRYARSKFELFVSDASQLFYVVHDMSNREAHRQRLAQFKRKFLLLEDKKSKADAALELCKMKGLLVDSALELNFSGEHKIMEAAFDGWSLSDLRLLIAAGVNTSIIDYRGNTAFKIACFLGHTETIEALHSLGLGSLHDNNPVLAAAWYGHTESVLALHRLKANVNDALRDGRTPIMVAAQGGHTNTVQTLHSLGADINAVDFKGQSATTFARNGGHTETVNALADLGAKQ
jgi:hypothetical protein